MLLFHRLRRLPQHCSLTPRATVVCSQQWSAAAADTIAWLRERRWPSGTTTVGSISRTTASSMHQSLQQPITDYRIQEAPRKHCCLHEIDPTMLEVGNRSQMIQCSKKNRWMSKNTRNATLLSSNGVSVRIINIAAINSVRLRSDESKYIKCTGCAHPECRPRWEGHFGHWDHRCPHTWRTPLCDQRPAMTSSSS